jgi:hypothetical protein
LKKRIINAHYRYYNLIIRRSCFSLSPCSHSSITFSRLCNHTHTIIIICSRYTQCALVPCSLFKFFLPSFSMLLLSSDHSKKKERERGREKKSVCKLLKSFMNERIEAKKGKTRCSHTLVVFFSLVLFIASIYFYLY